jgi:predicted RNase H-like HicB family nuclease
LSIDDCSLQPRLIRNSNQPCVLLEGRAQVKYLVVVEKAAGNYSAYVPDLPGCIATGATAEDVQQNIREAIAMHMEGLREDGLPVPAPQTQAEFVEA